MHLQTEKFEKSSFSILPFSKWLRKNSRSEVARVKSWTVRLLYKHLVSPRHTAQVIELIIRSILIETDNRIKEYNFILKANNKMQLQDISSQSHVQKHINQIPICGIGQYQVFVSGVFGLKPQKVKYAVRNSINLNPTPCINCTNQIYKFHSIFRA